MLRWTRQEEFTWAYFRPAAAIDIEAGLDEKGTLTSWHFVNVNSGGSAIETPYRAGKARSQFVGSNAPLRQGSYRALASTANNFARESFMDELAAAAGKDPLEFRQAHLENRRLRPCWKRPPNASTSPRDSRTSSPTSASASPAARRRAPMSPPAQIRINDGKITVTHVCEVFECGAILNPDNLLSQVQAAIIMGMGPALREEMRFEGGKMLNASFWGYDVPRFEDVPQLDIELLNRPDLSAIGAGETPIIAIAPAIANAVFHATGQRIRQNAHPPAGCQSMMTELHQSIVDLIDAGRSFAVATILSDSGHTPRKAGTKAIIHPDGSIDGTIGGGAVEAEAQRLAVQAIHSGNPVIFDFALTGETAAAHEPICGGQVRHSDRPCRREIPPGLRTRRRYNPPAPARHPAYQDLWHSAG